MKKRYFKKETLVNSATHFHKVVLFLIFLSILPTVFHSCSTSLNFCQHCEKVPFTPHPSQHLFVVLLMIAILTGVRQSA